MALRVFPTDPLPDSVTDDVEPKVKVITYGDGYEQVRKDGLNNQLRTWKLNYKQESYAKIKVIRDFLVSTQGVEAFSYLPPGETVPATVRVSGAFSRSLPHFDRIADFSFSLREVVL